MNALLEEILREQVVRAPDGSNTPLSSAVSREEGLFLQELIRELRPRTTLEVGLAHGISALFICEALRAVGGTRHIVIDPYQHKGNAWGGSWNGIGLSNLEQAGFSDLVEFHPEPSHRALPRLESEGLKVDFAFVDSWHTFDHTLVEFFCIDHLLNPGGVVAFDDADWPSVRKVCRYILTNRAYSVFRVLPSAPEDQQHRPDRRWLRRMPWTSKILTRYFKPEVVRTDRDLGIASRCVALRKEMEDVRSWDFHTPF